MVLNQYSFVILSVAIVAGLLLWAAWRGFQTQDLIAVAALALGCTLAFVLFAPRATSDDESTLSLGDGTPLLLELQSPY